MTHITVYRNKREEFVGFTVIGHAGHEGAGGDIVCAAVSVLVINTCNAIEKFTEEKFSLTTNEPEGLIDLRLGDRPSEQAELLISAMVLGIQGMAEDDDYKAYIQLEFEEV